MHLLFVFDVIENRHWRFGNFLSTKLMPIYCGLELVFLRNGWSSIQPCFLAVEFWNLEGVFFANGLLHFWVIVLLLFYFLKWLRNFDLTVLYDYCLGFWLLMCCFSSLQTAILWSYSGTGALTIFLRKTYDLDITTSDYDDEDIERNIHCNHRANDVSVSPHIRRKSHVAHLPWSSSGHCSLYWQKFI